MLLIGEKVHLDSCLPGLLELSKVRPGPLRSTRKNLWVFWSGISSMSGVLPVGQQWHCTEEVDHQKDCWRIWEDVAQPVLSWEGKLVEDSVERVVALSCALTAWMRWKSCSPYWVVLYKGKKVKASHTRHQALGPELIPVYRQSACRWP